MISRTHFEAIARTMAETKNLEAHSRALAMADTLAAFNPNFDKDKFVTAALTERTNAWT